MTAARYLGITDDSTVCDCCGRRDLAKTIMITYCEDGALAPTDILYYGSSCAARVLSTPVKKVRGYALAADTKRRNAIELSRDFLAWFDAEGVASFRARGQQVSQDKAFNRQANKYIWANRFRDFPPAGTALTMEQEERKRRVTLDAVAYHATVVETGGVSAL